MAAVTYMLNNEAGLLPPPSKPAFILRENMLNSKLPEDCQNGCSINYVTITDISGR